MLNSKVFREVNGQKIEGRSFLVIVNNFNYWLTPLVVFADGMIDCWGLMDRAEFIEKLNSGWIRVSVPDNSVLYMGTAKISVSEFIPDKDNSDFLKEVDETILELSGKQSDARLCINLFKNYLLENSEINFNELKKVFERLPRHKRVLFEYVYHKDPLYKLMTGEVENYDLESRRFMLNDYFEGEWDDKLLK